MLLMFNGLIIYVNSKSFSIGSVPFAEEGALGSPALGKQGEKAFPGSVSAMVAFGGQNLPTAALMESRVQTLRGPKH